jgi:hypothetical protein
MGTVQTAGLRSAYRPIAGWDTTEPAAGPRAIREETHVMFVTRRPEASTAGNAAAAVRATRLVNAVAAL